MYDILSMGCTQVKEKDSRWDDDTHWMTIARSSIRKFDQYSDSIKDSIIHQIRYNNTCNV
jgi:hypothetical protein